MPGTLFIVATPIGNLEDVTLRAIRVLREADLIAAEDTRHTATLLRHYAITTPTTSFHDHNERDKTPALVQRMVDGQRIALVSDAGTPSISDPGYRLVRAAHEAGVRVEPIPGPSAAIAALVGSGLPTDTFTFFGFAPSRASDRRRWLEGVASSSVTAVFFESPHRIQRTIEELMELTGPERELAIGRELTKTHEQLVKRHISQILPIIAANVKGEFTVVLSPAPSVREERPFDVTAIASEFGYLTNSNGKDRRAAIRELAGKYGVSARQIYAAVEAAKKVG
jgi:16S rRNA (cytidine1402-2'-O)-methyltransferase